MNLVDWVWLFMFLFLVVEWVYCLWIVLVCFVWFDFVEEFVWVFVEVVIILKNGGWISLLSGLINDELMLVFCEVVWVCLRVSDVLVKYLVNEWYWWWVSFEVWFNLCGSSVCVEIIVVE